MTSDRLLHFVMQLQNERSPAKRRQMLLNYVRQCSGAQFAVLFALVPGEQAFVLRGHSGVCPVNAPRRVPVGGGLSAVLTQQGWMAVPVAEKERRLLSEEVAWAQDSAYTRLFALQTGRRADGERGVLWLSMRSAEAREQEAEEDMRACVALLPAYLSLASVEMEEEHGEEDDGNMIGEQNAHEIRGVEVSPLSLAAGLERLYRVLLIGERGVEQDELYALALEQMSELVRAEQAWLYRYESDKKRFVLAATRGAEGADRIQERLPEARMLEELAEREPSETLTALQVENGVLWLLPLSYEPGLAGVAVFLLPEDSHAQSLQVDIRLVLAYLARGTILLLRDSDAHKAIQLESMQQERARLARDIHDGPAQQLTLALLKLEYVQRFIRKSSQGADEPLWEKVIGDLERIYTVLHECTEDLRHTITSERPMQLERESFGIAIRTLINEFRENNPDISIDVTSNPARFQQFPQEIETPVFRFVQEALNNVLKHAQASHVTVDARVQNEFLRVSVQDNGVGFQPNGGEVGDANEQNGMHLGLRAMRERIVSAGGTFEVQSKEGEGTTVVALLPLNVPSLNLTEREREVVRLMSEGLTNRAIAGRLLISVETVKTHIQHIMQKLQAKDRTQAVALALRRGLI